MSNIVCCQTPQVIIKLEFHCDLSLLCLLPNFGSTLSSVASLDLHYSLLGIISKFTKMIPNGYLIFEDESFLDSTVAKMNALRKSGQFCDVRLQVCGHELMAHRAVLACCSPYLSMGDVRVLAKVDAFIQEHLLEVSEQEDFLKLPRLKLEVMLEDNLTLPSNGKLYSKVLNWVQRSLWENGDQLERLMEEVY
ncbi:hypothetical protein PFLUV_G00108040 [Perca fluviatilis]|uniref:BTB domain-containing protein n=1 Tax=Perca fluviatilis TaxID=8168 RepID=A0A6A5F8T4_PERFL|nr:hypothetical protein PFLUV_G00108040 [Perca fluviatilis]